MDKTLKALRYLMLLSGLALIGLGIAMLISPLRSLSGIAHCIGGVMAVSGIADLASFFGRASAKRSGLRLASGAVTTLAGVWTLFGRGSSILAAILPFLFAASVTVFCAKYIADSTLRHTQGDRRWAWMLAFGITGVLLGVVLLRSPVISAVLIVLAVAATLVVYGANNVLLFLGISLFGGGARKDAQRQSLGSI